MREEQIVPRSLVLQDIDRAGGQQSNRRERNQGLHHHHQFGPSREDRDIGGRKSVLVLNARNR
jgi:hypothetical protein